MRICSGKFEKGMEAWHTGTGRKIRLSQPTQFMAQERTVVEEAYAGDIIGLFDPGIFSIGDTLSADSEHLKYDNIPTFPSEHFARVTFADSMK
jgi:peptide chain release factor 3